MARVEGQMWIDKVSPNKLKYYVNDIEYEVEVTPSFQIPSDSGVSKGFVACLRNGKLYPAQFPSDMTNVVGVVGNSFKSMENSAEVTYAHILRNGILILEEEDVNAVMDTTEVPKGMSATDLVGAPVYWFIGKWNKDTDGTFTYTDPSTKAGKLTLYTPAGFQWKQTNLNAEPSLNVGFDYLPTMGTIKKIEISGNIIKRLIIDVNFTGIEESFGWTWPHYHFENGSNEPDTITPVDGVASVIIRHGLFPKKDTSAQPSCVCNVLIKKHIDDSTEEEYNANVAIDNSLKRATGYDTKLEMRTPDTYKYLVHGSIAYRLDKGHN